MNMKQSVIVALTLAYSQAHGFAPTAFVVRPSVVLKYTETPPTSLVDWFGTDEIAQQDKQKIGSKEDWVAQEFNKAELATQTPKQHMGPVEWFAYASQQQQQKSPPTPRAGTWKGSVPDTHVGVPEWMIQTYGATSNNQVVDTRLLPNAKADWFAVESAEKMPEPAGTWKGSVPDTHVGVPDWMIQTYGATSSNQVVDETSKVHPKMKTEWFAVESAEKMVPKHKQKLQDVRMDRQVPQWLVKTFGKTGKASMQSVQTSDAVDWFATASQLEPVQPVAKRVEQSLGKERQELANWMAHKFTTHKTDKVVKVLPVDSVDWFATTSPACVPQGEVTQIDDALDHADWFDFASSSV